jgi:hypothetical protein
MARSGTFGLLIDVLRRMRDAERLATSRLRRLPDFLIIGAQKSGTTSLYHYLVAHPSIAPAKAKGVHYFEEHYGKGIRWYRSRFPVDVNERLTGEATPEYLFYPHVPERVARDLPAVRLIALLRNPIDRAYSHYQHERALGAETLSFPDALAAEDDRLRGELERAYGDPEYLSHALLHHSYRSRGLYADQLRRWLGVVPRERILILGSERLFDDPAGVTDEALSFLGLTTMQGRTFPKMNARAYQPMEGAIREELRRSFHEPNEDLYRLVGRRFDWM